MNRCVFWQRVSHKNTHVVAFYYLDGGAWSAAVVTPALSAGAGRKLVLDFLSAQVELFNAFFHFIRQCPAV